MRYLKKAAWLTSLSAMALGLIAVLPAAGQSAGKTIKIISTASLIGEVSPCG